jgi:hypothetical protein
MLKVLSEKKAVRTIVRKTIDGKEVVVSSVVSKEFYLDINYICVQS